MFGHPLLQFMPYDSDHSSLLKGFHPRHLVLTCGLNINKIYLAFTGLDRNRWAFLVVRVHVEYVALALSSGLVYSARASGPPTAELEVAPKPSGFRVRASGPNCWAASDGVSASFESFELLQIVDTNSFCATFVSDNTTSAVVLSSGKQVFGSGSAIFVGSFASFSSCHDTFSKLLTACYGTASPSKPVTLGGNIVDPGGANLAVSFGSGAQF